MNASQLIIAIRDNLDPNGNPPGLWQPENVYLPDAQSGYIIWTQGEDRWDLVYVQPDQIIGQRVPGTYDSTIQLDTDRDSRFIVKRGNAVTIAEGRANYARSRLPGAGISWAEFLRRTGVREQPDGYLSPQTIPVDFGFGDEGGFLADVLDMARVAGTFYGLAVGIPSLINAAQTFAAQSFTTPLLETAAESFASPLLETAAESFASPLLETAAESFAPPLLETAAESFASPLLETAAESFASPLLETAAESFASPLLETAAESFASPLLETAAESFASPLLETAAESFASPLLETAAESFASPLLETAAESFASPLLETAAESVLENSLLDIADDFMPTISDTGFQVTNMDEFDFGGDAWTDSGDTWADGWDAYESGDSVFIDSPAYVEPDASIIESVVDKPQATMPEPGRPVEVFRPQQSGMPGASASVSLDKILSGGASLLRQILNPSTSGTRVDPRTGRPIPPGAAIDPRTGLPMLDARGNFVRAGSASMGGNQPLILGALALGAFVILRKRRA